MDYKHFNELFNSEELTVDNISRAIALETKTVLCLNKDGYYIDVLDDYLGEDDTIDVPTDIAKQVIALPGITSKTVKGIKVFQIK